MKAARRFLEESEQKSVANDENEVAFAVDPSDAALGQNLIGQMTALAPRSKIKHALLRLPPLGGRVLDSSRRIRLLHVIQIALLSLLVALAVILTIVGALQLLEPASWRDTHV